MAETDLQELLGRFGLSDTEIDTYLALLRHGEAKPKDIAAEADISKRHAYSVCERLEAKRFVEVKSHASPTTIRAYPPEEVIESLQTDIDTLGPALTELYTNPKPTGEEIDVVKSRITVLKRLRQHISHATEEIVLSIPANYLEEVEAELRDARSRGVFVILIVTNDNEDVSFEGIASVVRSGEEIMPTILGVDSRRGVFAPTELLLRTNADRRGISFQQDQLGPVLVGSFLGNYWPLTEEQMVSEPAPLPASYRSFRHAAFQATLHIRNGTELRAEVDGQWTDEGAESVTVTGTVTEVRQGLLRPTSNTFPVEHSFVLEVDGTEVTVGGPGAFVEEIEASEISFDRVE